MLKTFYNYASIINSNIGGDGVAMRPLPGNGGAEELHGDPAVESNSKVWTRGQKCKK